MQTQYNMLKFYNTVSKYYVCLWITFSLTCWLFSNEFSVITNTMRSPSEWERWSATTKNLSDGHASHHQASTTVRTTFLVNRVVSRVSVFFSCFDLLLEWKHSPKSVYLLNSMHIWLCVLYLHFENCHQTQSHHQCSNDGNGNIHIDLDHVPLWFRGDFYFHL